MDNMILKRVSIDGQGTLGVLISGGASALESRTVSKEVEA